MLEEIRDIIKDSDMVLIGLGEEFDDIPFLKKDGNYSVGRRYIEEEGLLWLLPAYDMECRKIQLERSKEIKDALNKLAHVLQDTNYFVISTSVNDYISEISWKDNRLVMPCGGSRKKQCCKGCGEELQDITLADKAAISFYLQRLLSEANIDKKSSMDNAVDGIPDLGRCSQCGEPLILNNIYAENYNENGYLPQWQFYTKWLQGTLNKKLVILELGVGMKFPSVIRFPFEKVAFYNQKASFYRVNENLYQMTEELKDKGVSISQNSIDWLRSI